VTSENAELPRPDPALRALEATFTGSRREDSGSSGVWLQNRGADGSVNVLNDIGGHRLA
jgi:hypothetical protein